MDLNHRQMALGQVLHGRPILGGPLTRVPPDVRADSYDFVPLRRLLSPPPVTDPGGAELRAEVAENEALLVERGIRYVILRRFPPHIYPGAGTPLAQERYIDLHPGLSYRRVGKDLLVTVR